VRAFWRGTATLLRARVGSGVPEGGLVWSPAADRGILGRWVGPVRTNHRIVLDGGPAVDTLPGHPTVERGHELGNLPQRSR